MSWQNAARLLLLSTTAWLSCSAQDRPAGIPSQETRREPQSGGLARRFLERIDQQIRELSPRYPQLSSWSTELQKNDLGIVGKRLSDDELIYYHAFTRALSSNYKDSFQDNGCQITIHLHNEASMHLLAGPAVKTAIFGLAMGDMRIVATVITENPENRELEERINNLIRAQAKDVGATQR